MRISQIASFIVAGWLLGGTAGNGQAANTPQNRVEPLSDGVLLTMTKAQVQATLGKPLPMSPRFPHNLNYPNMGFWFDVTNQHITEVTVRRGVAIHVGLEASSSFKGAQRLFHLYPGPYASLLAEYDQYRVLFTGRRNRLISIFITPAFRYFAPLTCAKLAGTRIPSTVQGTWREHIFRIGKKAPLSGPATIHITPNGTFQWLHRIGGETAHVAGSVTVQCNHVTLSITDFPGFLNWGRATLNAKAGTLNFGYSDSLGYHRAELYDHVRGS